MHEDSILLKYPALYAKCFDFSPPSGWRPIVERLSASLAATGTARVLQVKEKFGGLRVYLGNCSDLDLELARVAEADAAHTCQSCGSDGAKLRGPGWYRTVCDGCAR